jgi:ATP-dependent RNA helicase DDX51/DBP6
MVAMKSKEQEDEAPPSDRVPHLPWMRHPVDIDSFSGRPATSLPRLDPRYHPTILYSPFRELPG